MSRLQNNLHAVARHSGRFSGCEGDAMSRGAVVDGYEILGDLGRGTTGVVYSARYPHNPVIRDRVVALKVPFPGAESETRWRTTCFRMECQALALLTQEPDRHFAQLLDVGGTAHRNLYPSNVMVSVGGIP